MKHILLILITFTLLISCSKPSLPVLSELPPAVQSNPDSLNTIVKSALKKGLFRRNIHFASGGDSGWLDPIRDAIEADTLNHKFASEQIIILDSLLKLNDTLIIMGVNPDYFKDQNIEIGKYLKDLKKVRRYLKVIDSVKTAISDEGRLQRTNENHNHDRRGGKPPNAIKLRDCRSALAEWIANNCTLKGTVAPHNLTLQGEGITNQEVTYSLNLIALGKTPPLQQIRLTPRIST